MSSLCSRFLNKAQLVYPLQDLYSHTPLYLSFLFSLEAIEQGNSTWVFFKTFLISSPCVRLLNAAYMRHRKPCAKDAQFSYLQEHCHGIGQPPFPCLFFNSNFQSLVSDFQTQHHSKPCAKHAPVSFLQVLYSHTHPVTPLITFSLEAICKGQPPFF